MLFANGFYNPDFAGFYKEQSERIRTEIADIITGSPPSRSFLGRQDSNLWNAGTKSPCLTA